MGERENGRIKRDTMNNDEQHDIRVDQNNTK